MDTKHEIPVAVGAVILGIVAVFLFLQGYKIDISKFFAAEPSPTPGVETPLQ